MRQLLMLSIATLALLAVPLPTLACGNSMHRDVVAPLGADHVLLAGLGKPRTVQEKAWSSIAAGEFESAQRALERDFPHLSPERVRSDHVRTMRKQQRDTLHALTVAYVRTRQHLPWATEMLEVLAELKTSKSRGHLAEAYALSDDAGTRDRGWAMLETLHRDRELSDPYTLTLLAVIRIQAGDVMGGRLALFTAQNQKRHAGLGDTVCCVVGEIPSGRGFGGIGLGMIGTAGKRVAEN